MSFTSLTTLSPTVVLPLGRSFPTILCFLVATVICTTRNAVKSRTGKRSRADQKATSVSSAGGVSRQQVSGTVRQADQGRRHCSAGIRSQRISLQVNLIARYLWARLDCGKLPHLLGTECNLLALTTIPKCRNSIDRKALQLLICRLRYRSAASRASLAACCLRVKQSVHDQ